MPEEDSEEHDTGVWTDQEMDSEQIRVLHKRFDANNDGKVSLNEILDFSKQARKDINAKRSKDEFSLMDENKDGKISVDEMTAFSFGAPLPDEVEMPAPSGAEAEEEKRIEKLKAVEKLKFKAADKDGDGFLTEDEALGVLYPEHHDEVLHVQTHHELKDRDKDGDGMLTYDEFWETDSEEPVDADSPETDLIKQQKEEFKMLDVDGSGKIDIEEYKKWQSGDFQITDAMKHLMVLADEDNDGYVTAAELDDARPSIANTMATGEFMQYLEHYEL
jgi:Ca2+-binding EF-hand superfamily protein